MKISTLKLAGALVVLVGLYFVIDMFGGKSKSKGVKSELVSLQLDKVDFLSVKSPQNEVELTKSDDSWSLKLPNGKIVRAEEAAVLRSIEALKNVKPSRLASKKKAKWSEYQVDSAGTRVIVKEEGKNALDLIIGKFSMVGQRSFQSFVRLYEDEATYVVRDFMSFSVPSDPNSYRFKTITDFLNKDSINTVKFNYQGDSSFVVEKLKGEWYSAGQVLDSVKIGNYLNNITRLSSSKFYDEELLAINPVSKIEFIGSDGSLISSLSSFNQDSLNIVISSINSDSQFNDESVYDKSFISLSELQ
ncbi:DUF4340 domain-containing protein [Reichenbachiella versicolor]|uniref:DUF4340 domain-containing protein n=1 Tax=Reichenbachiella versicolor TaxID=1821036 RepID=UPI000D6E4214|nr:DUF4340 domain-containing protein [Reichenbachiella versicolor]